MAFPMTLEQQITCILQSKHQQILKIPRHEQESRTGLLSTLKWYAVAT